MSAQQPLHTTWTEGAERQVKLRIPSRRAAATVRGNKKASKKLVLAITPYATYDSPARLLGNWADSHVAWMELSLVLINTKPKLSFKNKYMQLLGPDVAQGQNCMNRKRI